MASACDVSNARVTSQRKGRNSRSLSRSKTKKKKKKKKKKEKETMTLSMSMLMKVEEDDGDIYSEFIIIFKFSPLPTISIVDYHAKERRFVPSVLDDRILHLLSDKTKDQDDRISSLSRRLKSRRGEQRMFDLTRLVAIGDRLSAFTRVEAGVSYCHCCVVACSKHHRCSRIRRERDLYTNEIKTSIEEDRSRSSRHSIG